MVFDCFAASLWLANREPECWTDCGLRKKKYATGMARSNAAYMLHAILVVVRREDLLSQIMKHYGVE